MESRRHSRRRFLVLGAGGLLAAACGGATAETVKVTTAVGTPTASPTPASAKATPSPTATAAQTCEAFARSADPYLLRVVDKQRGLPADYRPSDLQAIDDRWAVPRFPGQALRAAAAGPLVQLLSAAEQQGVQLRVRSSFRSYQEQARTFQFWIDQLGEAQARRESAPPGHSEHQLGTTADVISASVGWELITAFGTTPEGRWLAAHAHEYGFAISYPPDGEAITGYIYEPWHIRYVGRPCSADWKAGGRVLVQFLERLPGR